MASCTQRTKRWRGSLHGIPADTPSASREANRAPFQGRLGIRTSHPQQELTFPPLSIPPPAAATLANRQRDNRQRLPQNDSETDLLGRYMPRTRQPLPQTDGQTLCPAATASSTRSTDPQQRDRPSEMTTVRQTIWLVCADPDRWTDLLSCTRQMDRPSVMQPPPPDRSRSPELNQTARTPRAPMQ